MLGKIDVAFCNRTMLFFKRKSDLINGGILLADDVPLDEFNMHLTFTADYINNFGELAEYIKEVPFSTFWATQALNKSKP